MTIQEPGKIQGTSDSNDAVNDAAEAAASITFELTLIGGGWVIGSIGETGVERLPRVTFADLSGDAAREVVLEAICTARAGGPAKPSFYLTVPLVPPRRDE